MTEETTANGEKEALETTTVDNSVKKKDPKDFIIERKQKQLEEARAKMEQLEEEVKVFHPGDEDIDAKITRAVTERIEIDSTISNFLKKYPSLEEKRGEIEKYAYDPSRKGVPVNTRILEAVGIEEFIKLGAKIGNEAELDIKNSRMGGDSLTTEREKTETQKTKEQYDNYFKKLPFMKNALKSYDKNNS